MEIIIFLSIVIAVVAVLTSIVLVRRVKKQIAEMTDVLVDVKNGNGNRRILSATNELTAPDRKSTRLNSSHTLASRMPSSA